MKRSKYKQIIVVPDSLAMSPGKMSAQVGHACVEAFRIAQATEAGQARIAGWTKHGITKVVVRAANEEELMEISRATGDAGLLDQFLVVDEGLTEVPPNSRTALCIGPYESEIIDPFTRHLKLR